MRGPLSPFMLFHPVWSKYGTPQNRELPHTAKPACSMGQIHLIAGLEIRDPFPLEPHWGKELLQEVFLGYFPAGKHRGKDGRKLQCTQHRNNNCSIYWSSFSCDTFAFLLQTLEGFLWRALEFPLLWASSLNPPHFLRMLWFCNQFTLSRRQDPLTSPPEAPANLRLSANPPAHIHMTNKYSCLILFMLSHQSLAILTLSLLSLSQAQEPAAVSYLFKLGFYLWICLLFSDAICKLPCLLPFIAVSTAPSFQGQWVGFSSWLPFSLQVLFSPLTLYQSKQSLWVYFFCPYLSSYSSAL